MLHHILDFAEHLHNAKKGQGFRSIAIPMKLKFLKYWEKILLLYSYAFILDPRAKLIDFSNVLELLASHTGTSYSLYYGDVKDEMSRLVAKYEQNFGAARAERPPMPHAGPGKRKQAWGIIYTGPGAPLPIPLLHFLHLDLVVLMNCQHTWTVILSRIGGVL
jgi:hypothetical protein